MKILHYSLGLPPFRRGGMTKYCDDLMLEEKRLGNNVYLLYPGELKNLSDKTNINNIKSNSINGEHIDGLFEIVNPLPVPLIDGIKNTEIFTIKKQSESYNCFFNQEKFDILHIHTLMGLPCEIINAARNNNVKIVYTTHDYYPICPRVFLFHDGMNCDDDHKCLDCIACNRNALGYHKMKLLQSNLYRRVKETKIVKKLRKAHNQKNYEASNNNDVITKKYNSLDTSEYENRADQYRLLRERNISLLNGFNLILYNSTNTQKTYHKYGTQIGKVINVTNGSIEDHRRYIKFSESLQIGYLGPAVTHKGFDLLIASLDKLWQDKVRKFHLQIYIPDKIDRPYITNYGPYEYRELSDVMDRMNLLVVPSVCGETFGFTTLEAQSYGVPAVVSSRVGSKDIIKQGVNGEVFDPTIDSLYSTLKRLIENPEIVKKYNDYILSNDSIYTMKQHALEIIQLYKRCDEQQ